eukprot:COSAG01_NODE_54404_length_332_cov_0.785408_1_plen_25_part_01
MYPASARGVACMRARADAALGTCGS